MITTGLEVDNSIAVIEDHALFGRQLCDILMLEGWTGRWFRRAEVLLEAQTRQQLQHWWAFRYPECPDLIFLICSMPKPTD